MFFICLTGSSSLSNGPLGEAIITHRDTICLEGKTLTPLIRLHSFSICRFRRATRGNQKRTDKLGYKSVRGPKGIHFHFYLMACKTFDIFRLFMFTCCTIVQYINVSCLHYFDTCLGMWSQNPVTDLGTGIQFVCCTRLIWLSPGHLYLLRQRVSVVILLVQCCKSVAVSRGFLKGKFKRKPWVYILLCT